MAKITRIDLYQNPDGLLVFKYPEGWTATTRPVERNLNQEWDLDRAVAWLTENGWTVRRWPGGARAWLGKPLPVRNWGQIKRKREELTQRRALFPDLQLHTIDLAFDL